MDLLRELASDIHTNRYTVGSEGRCEVDQTGVTGFSATDSDRFRNRERPLSHSWSWGRCRRHGTVFHGGTGRRRGGSPHRRWRAWKR